MLLCKDDINKLKISKKDIIMVNSKKTECILTKTMFDTVFNVIIGRPEYKKIANYVEYSFETERKDQIFDIDQVYPDITTLINPGGNEGAFLDIYLSYRNGLGGINSYPLGCIKTLDESIEGYIALGELAGMFVYLGHQFLCVNEKLFNKRYEYGIITEKVKEGRDVLKLYNSETYPLFTSSLKSGLLVYSDKDMQEVLEHADVLAQVFYVVEEHDRQNNKKTYCISKEISDDIPQSKIEERFGCITKYVYFPSYEEAVAYKEIMQESN